MSRIRLSKKKKEITILPRPTSRNCMKDLRVTILEYYCNYRPNSLKALKCIFLNGFDMLNTNMKLFAANKYFLRYEPKHFFCWSKIPLNYKFQMCRETFYCEASRELGQYLQIYLILLRTSLKSQV